MKIAVDAMGGDNAPRDVVEGVVRSVRERGSQIVLVGDQSQVREAMRRAANGVNLDSVSVQHASQVIGMGESPVTAVKNKKDSSIVVAASMVREQRASAMVSMGNTGACMAAALLEMGRIGGVERPAIAVPIPHAHGITYLLDGGANVDCKPSQLVQFAVMGDIYAEQVMGVHRPRVGLLNVGEEEGKGGEVVQEAFSLLRKAHLEFIGNVEGRDIANGRVDVVVCDGFVGNIVLKFAEGMTETIMDLIEKWYRRGTLFMKLGALLSRPVMRMMKEYSIPPRWAERRSSGSTARASSATGPRHRRP
jgi:glycerol-3-phosphate acyltransferase PlsX